MKKVSPVGLRVHTSDRMGGRAEVRLGFSRRWRFHFFTFHHRSFLHIVIQGGRPRVSVGIRLYAEVRRLRIGRLCEERVGPNRVEDVLTVTINYKRKKKRPVVLLNVASNKQDAPPGGVEDFDLRE